MTVVQSTFDNKYGDVSGIQKVEIVIDHPPPPPIRSVVLTLTPRAAQYLLQHLQTSKWPSTTEGGNDLNAISHNLKPAIKALP